MKTTLTTARWHEKNNNTYKTTNDTRHTLWHTKKELKQKQNRDTENKNQNIKKFYPRTNGKKNHTKTKKKQWRLLADIKKITTLTKNAKRHTAHTQTHEKGVKTKTKQKQNKSKTKLNTSNVTHQTETHILKLTTVYNKQEIEKTE